MLPVYLLTVVAVTNSFVVPSNQEISAINNRSQLAGNAFQFAVDCSSEIQKSVFDCVKQTGYQQALVRAYSSADDGSVDTAGIQSVKNANSAGLSIHAYMTPQPFSFKSESDQVNEMYNGLNNAGFQLNTLIIEVATTINWGANQKYCSTFIQNLLAAGRQKNLVLVIFTKAADWKQITGNMNPGNDVLLWYKGSTGQGVTGATAPNFDDFRPFAGWTQPVIKQFADGENICCAQLNRNVIVGSATARTMRAIVKT